jgi:alanyl-tRNA synthetase
MNATERLYYTDSHLTEFDATVVALEEIAPGRIGLLLDRTAFYPTGGGQPFDTGMINEARVVDCIDRESAGVLHVVEASDGSLPRAGEHVRGRVDWGRRLEHIQQHTGQHILSQAFVQLFDAPTRSFRMMERVCEIDVELAEPSDERVERAVDLANRIVWEDRAVKVLTVTTEEAARLPLRKDSAREGDLRVVEIEGFDLSPCGGTHAKRAGEVGVIITRSWERAKGLVRVEFAAGQRALADYRLANRTARTVAALFSAAREDAPAHAARLVEEHKQLSRRTRALEEIASRVEAEDLLQETTTREDGAKIVTRVLADRDADSLKRLASAIASHAGAVALLGSREGEQARLVFARSVNASGDMNALMREACALLGGRGGGKADMAQGGGRRVEKLNEAIEAATRRLATA